MRARIIAVPSFNLGVFVLKKVVTILLMLIMITANIVCFAQSDVQRVIADENQLSVLATVRDIDSNYIYVELYDTVGPDNPKIMTHKTLKLNKFRYTYCKTHADEYNSPKIGDNIYISLYEKNDGTYTVSNAAYKTDTVDLRTLNVYVPEETRNNSCMAEVAAISYFIRSDGSEKNISVTDGVVTLEHNGEKTRLYPSETEKALPVIYIDKTGQIINDEKKQQDVINVVDNPIDQAKEIYNSELVFAKRIIAISIIAIGFIAGIIGIYINSNKKKNRGI